MILSAAYFIIYHQHYLYLQFVLSNNSIDRSSPEARSGKFPFLSGQTYYDVLSRTRNLWARLQVIRCLT
jgi:hypothetical protein